MQKTSSLCDPLPTEMTSWVTTCQNRKQFLINFLENTLPLSDTKNLIDELRKHFMLTKCKAKTTRKRNFKRIGKSLTVGRRAQLGLDKIGRQSDMKYIDLLSLNKLWLEYMQNMLGNKPLTEVPRTPVDPNWESVNQQLAKADFHGARISVTKATCPSLVGITGIVIQDKKNTFRICGEDNIIRTLPKNTIELKIYLNEITLRVLGKQLCTRPAERTVKKLKSTRVFEL